MTSIQDGNLQRMFGQVKQLDKKDIFIDSALYAPMQSQIESDIQVYEYLNPKFKRHRCKLLKKAKLPKSEIDYMVY